MPVQQNVLSTTPENRETPLAEVQSWVTPNRWFFVRSHFETPQIVPERWSLRVAGRVEHELDLRLDQLDQMPRRSVFATMECAGNGRSFLRPLVEGVQWTAGAVGHAEWAGVPLRYVLEQAGLKPDTKEIIFHGADHGVEHGASESTNFARSLPIEKAMHPDTLLATHMNGEPLEPSHGFPMRLLVPGWYGVASVKWLTQIVATAEPFQGYYQTVKYTIQRQSGRGTSREMVGPMPVKSEIIRPVDGAVMGIGGNAIFGMAWAGEHAVACVEVSVDGGKTWRQARLQGPREPYSWTPWEYLWEASTAGDYSLLARAVAEDGQVQPTQHDRDRGGYLINFSRPIEVRIDAGQLSHDLVGDAQALQQEMNDLARQRSGQRLDAEIEFTSGAGI